MHLYQIPVISPHFGFDFYKISPVWPGALQLPCFLRFQRISTLNQLISTILSSLTAVISRTPQGMRGLKHRKGLLCPDLRNSS
nr:MAG TPA: hypothetical protein [Bacteriophage sp.]